MILARFSRSDSACFAMARCISCGRSTAFTATWRHLHAPGVGVLVDHLLQTRRQALALGEQLVEVGLAQDAAQRRLRLLARGVEVVLDLDDRLQRVHHAEVDDRVHLHADVVARDHVLGRHVEHDRAQAHAHHAVDGPGHDDEARAPWAAGSSLPSRKIDAALVLVQDLHRQQQPEHHEAEYEHNGGITPPFGPGASVLRRTRPRPDRRERLLGPRAPALPLHDHPALGLEIALGLAAPPHEAFAAGAGRAPLGWVIVRRARAEERLATGDPVVIESVDGLVQSERGSDAARSVRIRLRGVWLLLSVKVLNEYERAPFRLLTSPRRRRPGRARRRRPWPPRRAPRR